MSILALANHLKSVGSLVDVVVVITCGATDLTSRAGTVSIVLIGQNVYDVSPKIDHHRLSHSQAVFDKKLKRLASHLRT